MASEIPNYALGKLGVDVDSSPIHADPSSLLKAQNAIRDVLGADGGLRNRPGLAKLNAVAGAGSLLGGITMPVFKYTDSRSLIISQFNSAAAAWTTSQDLFATSSVLSAIAAWKDASVYYSLATNVCRMGVFYKGQLYYAASGYTVGTTSPTIRIYNGSDDHELCKVLPATTKGITGMFVSKGVLFVLTLDSGTTDSNFVGSVYTLNEKGHLNKQGDSLPTGYVPTAIIYYNDKYYVGGSRLTTTNEAKVFWYDPYGLTTSWSTDLTCDADDYQITGFASHQGLLYATTKNGGAATKGKVKARALAGTWSTADSTLNNSGTYEDIISFGGFLYASSRSYSTTTSTAVIRRSADGVTWATVYNATSTAGVGLFTELGLRLVSKGLASILHTTNGTSWTLASPAGSGNVDGGILGTLLVLDAPVWADPVDAASEPAVQVTNVNVTGLTTAQVTGTAVVWVTRSITVSEFRALNSAAIEILPATPDVTYIPVAFFFELAIGTVFNTASSVNLYYTGAAAALMTGISWSNSGNRYVHYKGVFSNNSGEVDFHPQGKGIYLVGGVDLVGGTFLSDAKVHIAYIQSSLNG